MNEYWQVTHDSDGIVTARYANGEMNYYVDAAVRELEDLLADCIARDASALILAGVERGKFITHFSPDEIQTSLRPADELTLLGPVRNDAVNRVLNSIAATPFPVIAAMNGDCMGFGYELALACDIRVGETGDYRYGLPEVRMGVVPGSGGMQRLQRLIGMDRALLLVLQGRIVTPAVAESLGMVTLLAEDAVQTARDLAVSISKNSRTATISAKRALRTGEDVPLNKAQDLDASASLRVKLSSTSAQALAQYLAVPVDERRNYLENI